MERRRLRFTLVNLMVVFVLGSTEEMNVDTRPEKLGRCPRLIDINVDDCRQKTNETSICTSDYQCPREDKCCYDGCTNVCTPPLYSACEHQLLANDRRARERTDSGRTVRCRPNGQFETVQCDEAKKECWCINEAGFELPGTRSNGSELVNCSAPRHCSGVMCRMLCPYDFALDADGCPLCQCRDPCSGVKCPGNQKCHLEDVICDSEPCPPIPSCKKARFLDTVCPTGEPLYLNEKSQPFLCGIEPSKPQCPPFFQCIVEDHMEYGACCPSLDKLEKPGKCPLQSDNGTQCGDKCMDDSSCMGLLKCCKSDDCGSHCVPSNSTVCEQQRMLAELMSRNEKSDRGYIPECNDDGQFKIKQCSRNGLVCWCVDSAGNKIARTMGPGENVSCTVDVRVSPSKCDVMMCQIFCEYGFKLDEFGCETCECADPCDGFSCPANERCITVYSEACLGSFCPSVPECKALVQKVHKRGICPSVEFLGCRNSSSTCVNDGDCAEDLKCCPHTCGSSCEVSVLPPDRLPTMCEYLRAYALSIVDSPKDHALAYSIPDCTKDGLYEPIQCNDGECFCVDEFGVELRGTRGTSKDVADCRAAQPRGSCLGLMCRLGCDYGFVRDESGCPFCECRNPCDGVKCAEGLYCQLVDVEQVCNGGFCPPIPKCVEKRRSSMCPSGQPVINPATNDTWLCQSDLDCPSKYLCLDIEGSIGICCSKSDSKVCQLPKEPGSCDNLMERWFYNNETLRCEVFIYGGCGQNLNNFGSQEECEKTCVVNVDSPPKNGTCPVVLDDEVGSCAEECSNDVDCPGPQKCCLNGCGAHVCRDPKGNGGKVGQCPYLLPISSDSCQLECKSDYDCEDDLKCCSNGCGTMCTDPELKTVCEHLKAIGEHRSREKGIPPSQMFIFSCSPDDGSFNPIQCLGNKTCWCVDEAGIEVPGTRLHGNQPKNCSQSRECPLVRCIAACQNGMQLDNDGCPTCLCRDPCNGISCLEMEECREVPVRCVDGPCPLVPMCLPKLENPCVEGQPLRDVESHNVIRCGPEGDVCPSTHKCHLSPLGEFAVCCPKPRDVCLQPQDSGVCLAAIPRWLFSATNNTCEEFFYGGCGGNFNNFQTKSDCEVTCPVMSSCEQAREKNSQLMTTYNRNIFIPKCNGRTGAWEPMQCLPSLGLCWCVNKDGEQLPGTLVRGIPMCSVRTGRNFADGNTTLACDNGKSVHVCSPLLCDNKICLRQPDAVCRVDPCGGCSVKFYDDSGHPIDCEEDLTPCQLEMQTVMNSVAWANQETPLPVALLGDEPVEFDLPNGGLRVKRDLENITELNETRSNSPSTSDSLQPVAEEEAALLMGTMIPQCTNKGAYSPTQSSGIYSWCVTPDGEPIESTLSRGNIQCSPRGEIISREESDEPLCPNKKWKPSICKNECLNVYCSSHPDAVCVADPCDNCKLSFFSSMGKPVSCEPKCRQPKVVGMCRASYRRYFFNDTSEKCEDFLYGGCGGNDNNFETMEECVQECKQSPNVCELSKRTGMCRAMMHRWYFNQHLHKCEKFIFGGCDGNDNNFETKEECEARCPDLVLCPSMDLVEMQTPCSRRLVCGGVACPGRDDLVCTVDPCNCSAMFVDLDGIPTSCDDTDATVTKASSVATEETITTETVPIPELPDYPIPRRTRCEKERVLARAWVQRQPTCDSQGRFEPTQCDESNAIQELCWCVDEAGNRVPDSLPFVKDTDTCIPRLVAFVKVTLTFQHKRGKHLSDKVVELRRAIDDILEQEDAKTTDEIAVTFAPDKVIVKFVLVGNRKIDAAYTLQEMVKYGMLKLQLGGVQLVAIPEESSFYQALVPKHSGYDDTLWLSATTIGALLIFTFLTVVLVCALIGGVVVYRKRRMGTYPRGSLESLASSTSPLYAYDTKVPPHISCVEHDYAILNAIPTEKKHALV